MVKKGDTKQTKEEVKKYTDEEVSIKLKEISKMDMPLDINKALRNLKEHSEYNITDLGKQVNYIRKESKKSVVTQVTEDTGVTDVTVVTNKETEATVTTVTCNSAALLDVFGDSVLESIFEVLLHSGKAISFGELAIKIGKSEVHIRNVISKNKQYFGKIKGNSKMSYTYLLQLALEEINLRIDEKKRQKANEEAILQKQVEQENLRENYEISIKNFIQETKPNRSGILITLDFNILLEHDHALADSFLDDPEKLIISFLNNYEDGFEIKILNLPKESAISIENVRKDHLDKMICVDGRITSFGEVKPVITKMKFECPSCGTIISVEQNYRIGNVREPSGCSCGRKNAFRKIEDVMQNSCFLQLEDLQEKTDNPHSQRIKSVIFNGLTESKNITIFSPGNEVRVVGVLKEVPIFKNNKKTVFLNWILEIKSAELIDKDIDINDFSKELVEDIQMLSNTISEKGLDILVESFAPEVYGYDKIKIALILQLANRRNDVRNKSIRNKPNILLIGDPGVAKTVLCDFSVDISSGSRKAVGGGSSAVGITASVVKEEDSLGGYRVEPGAMILAKDLLFIDEMNNLSDEDKPKLQEGMNEQRVSIDKANLHVKMPVTCGILAAANPKHGNFRETMSNMVHTEFNIPTPILNRFDTIFVLKDKVDEETDKKIAEKMIKRHKGTLTNKYDRDFLRKFFSYIKLSDEPEINNDMEEYLKQIYSDARSGAKGNVCINPRFLESLNRMATASAKLRQSKKIEKKDVDLSLSILAESQYSK